MNVKRLRLGLSSSPVMLYRSSSSCFSSCTQQLQAHAHLRFHSQRSMLFVCGGIRHHVIGSAGASGCSPSGSPRQRHSNGNSWLVVTSGSPASLACAARAPRSSAYADPTRAARQFRDRSPLPCAEYVADAEPRGQIEFLPHERFVLAQRPVSAKRDSLLLGAQPPISPPAGRR